MEMWYDKNNDIKNLTKNLFIKSVRLFKEVR